MSFIRNFTARSFAGALLLALATPALAQTAVPAACTAPTAPLEPGFTTLTKPVKPAPLACDEANKCKKPEVDAYNAAVAKYNADAQAFQNDYNKRVQAVNDYVVKLNDFSRAVQTFMDCERVRTTAAASPNV